MIDSTSLIYKGKVNIKVGRKTYTNYNAGTFILFNLIARLLTRGQNSVELNELPSQLDIRNGGESILNTYINCTRQYKLIPVDSNTSQPATVITAAITDSNISNDKITGDGIYILVLMDGRAQAQDLASIKIDWDILRQIATGRQAVIEWSLYFENTKISEEA